MESLKREKPTQDWLFDFYSKIINKKRYEILDEDDSLLNLKSQSTPESYFKEYRKYNILFPQIDLGITVGLLHHILKNKINLKDVLSFEITQENIDRIKKDLLSLHGKRNILVSVSDERLTELIKSFNLICIVAIFKTLALFSYIRLSGSVTDQDLSEYKNDEDVGYIDIDVLINLIEDLENHKELLTFFETLTEALNSEQCLSLSRERLKIINYEGVDPLTEEKNKVRKLAADNADKISEVLTKVAIDFFEKSYNITLDEKQLDLLVSFFVGLT